MAEVVLAGHVVAHPAGGADQRGRCVEGRDAVLKAVLIDEIDEGSLLAIEQDLLALAAQRSHVGGSDGLG